LTAYRLQLAPDFGFAAARALVPYLRELGVTKLYLSPVLQARRGSTHGYDVVDPTRVSEQLGGEAQLRELCAAGLDVLLDIVPNHMAASEEENPYWRDPELRLRFFDVDPETGWHRRFFDIGELAGVRVEDELVFQNTHSKILELVRDGLVQGLRVDHVDGLANPREYLERLRGIPVWVEKILEPGERLPADWPVEGTTGYEFANDVTALFVDPAAEEQLTQLYEGLTGETRPFAQIGREAKLEQARTTFRPEVERLAHLSGRPVEELEVELASLPVYRTYEEGDEFTTRFQQTTGAVMAKGVEDTAFYRYARLLALNEVGGDPGRFSLAVDEFHRASLERPPRNLLATTTHDTKRSGDVRARLAALSYLPAEWEELVRPRLAGDPNEAYFVLQTLVGAWPPTRERLAAYLEKALREAKVSSNWLEPNVGHEQGVIEWATGLLDDPELASFSGRLAEHGRRVSLGMTLLKLTCPGIPDVYQGDELEFLALVDPDNRRPVDWELHLRLLGQVKAGAAPNDETMKLHLIVRALALRARRPDAFAGAYEPVEVGPDVCAFRRGDDVGVEVPLRPGATKGLCFETRGWRDLLPELPVGLYERTYFGR
jgi:(1->4)-alpha-D-glucan 1-alpha-D-glucosylmutase